MRIGQILKEITCFGLSLGLQPEKDEEAIIDSFKKTFGLEMLGNNDSVVCFSAAAKSINTPDMYLVGPIFCIRTAEIWDEIKESSKEEIYHPGTMYHFCAVLTSQDKHPMAFPQKLLSSESIEGLLNIKAEEVVTSVTDKWEPFFTPKFDVKYN